MGNNVKSNVTGVILAGGLNKRFGGINKAFIEIGRASIFEHIYHLFREVFSQVLLVTNDPMSYLKWDVRIVRDIYSERSSLTGMHAGLFYSNTPNAFFTACDTPFLKKDLVEFIAAGMDKKIDVVIPQTFDGMEPLCAVYSRRCLKPIEACIEAGDLRIRGFFKNVRVKKIGEPILREKDPGLLSFFNINTPCDLSEAKRFYKGIENQEIWQRKSIDESCPDDTKN